MQQVRLGILSSELRPGERLPSTRQLARRYGMHANTVSAAFQQLREEGWIEKRQGSGVYVTVHGESEQHAKQRTHPPATVGSLLQQLAALANTNKLPAEELHAQLDAALQQTLAPVRRVLVEPDRELARIVQHEIAAVTGIHLPYLNMKIADFPMRLHRALDGATAVVLPSKSAAAHAILPQEQVFAVQINTVSEALASQLPNDREYLVAVASAWPPFLEIAQVMLTSVGFSPDSLMFRDTRQNNWQDGLAVATAVVCDSVTAELLPETMRALRFPVIANASLEQLQQSSL